MGTTHLIKNTTPTEKIGSRASRLMNVFLEGRFSRQTLTGRLSLLLLVTCISAWTLCGTVCAQTFGTGSIQGTVVDQTGADVAGATVAATDPATGHAVTVRTSNLGFYVLPALPPATYSVAIRAAGFKDVIHQTVSVNAFATVTLNVSLQVGEQTETVVVSAAPPQLNTANGTLEVSIPHETYNSLPVAMLGGPKSPLGFVSLAPGVVEDDSGVPTVIVNGSAGQASAMYLNGMPVINLSIGGDPRLITNNTPIEAVENSQILSSGIPAYYQGAGVVNLILKSGTDKFHGSVYENVRNTVFDAAGYFSDVTPVEHQNEYGLTVGGPILRNRLFFFFGYDAFRYRSGVNPEYYSLPTAAERNGDFSALPVPIYDPATVHCVGSVCTATAFPGNIIPSTRISSIAKALQADLPSTINSSLQRNYLGAYTVANNQDQYIGKLDFAVTKSNYLSFLVQDGQLNTPALPDNNGPMLPVPYANSRYDVASSRLYQIKDTHTISPNMVNVFGYQMIRSTFDSTNPTNGGGWGQKVGLTGLPGAAADNFPAIGFQGPNSPSSWAQSKFSKNVSRHPTTNVFQDNLQWVRGNHNITIGGQLEYDAENVGKPSYVNAITFSNRETAGFSGAGTLVSTHGNAYASFLLGEVDSASIIDSGVPLVGMRFKQYALYVQDDWRVSRKLNINLGYRYQIPIPLYEVNNRLSFLNATKPNPAVGNHPGALEFAGNGPDGCHCKTPIETHYLAMEPRVGFAYTPKNGTVVRGSFSIMHFLPNTFTGDDGNLGQLGYTAQPGFSSPNSGINSAFNWADGIPSYIAPPFIDATLNTGYNTTTPKGGSVTYADPKDAGRLAYSEFWNVTLEQQLTPATVMSVSYAASASHLLALAGGYGIYSNQLNPKYLALGSLLQATETPTTLAQAQAIMPGIGLPYANFKGSIAQMLRPFPQYSGIGDIASYGSGYYNSLQVLLQHRMSKGLYLHAAYTWGKQIDNAGGESTRPGMTAGARSAYTLANNRSVSTASPHVFVVAGNYLLPFGRGHALGGNNAVVNALVGNWKLSAIVKYRTAGYLGTYGAACNLPSAGSCYADYNPSFTGPVRINGSYGAGQSQGLPKVAPVPHIDVNAFQNPAPFTYGTTPRTAAYGIRDVGSANEDVSLDKTFDLKDRTSIKFRASAFNIFNRTELGGIDTNINSSSFGTIGTQNNIPREMQFEAYFMF